MEDEMCCLEDNTMYYEIKLTLYSNVFFISRGSNKFMVYIRKLRVTFLTYHFVTFTSYHGEITNADIFGIDQIISKSETSLAKQAVII